MTDFNVFIIAIGYMVMFLIGMIIGIIIKK